MKFIMTKKWSAIMVGMLGLSLALLVGASMRGIGLSDNEMVLEEDVGTAVLNDEHWEVEKEKEQGQEEEEEEKEKDVKKRKLFPDLFGKAGKSQEEMGIVDSACACGEPGCTPCGEAGCPPCGTEFCGLCAPPLPPCAPGHVLRPGGTDDDDDDDSTAEGVVEDDDAVCVPCGGGVGAQPCCDNHKCRPGRVCRLSDKRCFSCGGVVGIDIDNGDNEGELCCPPPARPCESGSFDNGGVSVQLFCNANNRCAVCGIIDFPCCDGMKCNAGSDLVCSEANICVTCGGSGNRCCAPPRMDCASGTCGTNGNCPGGGSAWA